MARSALRDVPAVAGRAHYLVADTMVPTAINVTACSFRAHIAARWRRGMAGAHVRHQQECVGPTKVLCGFLKQATAFPSGARTHSEDRTRMMIRTVGRATAWFALAAIIVLSLVPPGVRPSTFMPHKIEHAGIFLLDGVAFGIAYCGYQWLASVMAVLFCAGIEVAQLVVPGRHARLSDFFVDAIAICVGIFGGSTLIRTKPA
jgi:hypothetical protein